MMKDDVLLKRDVVRGLMLIVVLGLGFTVGRCSVGEQYPPLPPTPKTAEQIRADAILACVGQQSNVIDISRRTPEVMGAILLRCRETFDAGATQPRT